MFTQPVQLTRGKTDITNMVVHVLAMERLQKGAFMVIGMLCNGNHKRAFIAAYCTYGCQHALLRCCACD